MPAENQPKPRPRAGRTSAGRRRVRRALTGAAIDLFLEHGYDATTIDEIAAAAGVGRRTFFRYFRSKEDAIFPDHDELLLDIERTLADADERLDPIEVVCDAVRLVLAFYLSDPEVSLKRYALTRTVTSLRDKEVASVDRYQRVFAHYLRERFHVAGDPLAEVRAPVVAAAVAAAHNHVLRQWLRSDGTLDAHALADQAFDLIGRAHSSPLGGEDTGDHADAAFRGDGSGTETVVAVLRTSAPVPELVRHINALGHDSGNDTECH